MGAPRPQGGRRDDPRGEGRRAAPGDHEGPLAGGDHLRPEKLVGERLRRSGKTLALAESCTGGLVASLLTDVPGSSDYFLLSLVTYSNRSKVELLGVRGESLERHGAVSEAVAREMAAGARRAGGADLGVAVTGIAGPGGGSREKPVGLVFFCVDDGTSQTVDRVVFPGDRLAVKRAAAEHALAMLLSRL